MEIKITRMPCNFKTDGNLLREKQFPFVTTDLDKVLTVHDYKPGQKTYQIAKQAGTWDEIIKLYQDCDSLEEFERRAILSI